MFRNKESNPQASPVAAQALADPRSVKKRKVTSGSSAAATSAKDVGRGPAKKAKGAQGQSHTPGITAEALVIPEDSAATLTKQQIPSYYLLEFISHIYECIKSAGAEADHYKILSSVFTNSGSSIWLNWNKQEFVLIKLNQQADALQLEIFSKEEFDLADDLWLLKANAEPSAIVTIDKQQQTISSRILKNIPPRYIGDIAHNINVIFKFKLVLQGSSHQAPNLFVSHSISQGHFAEQLKGTYNFSQRMQILMNGSQVIKTKDKDIYRFQLMWQPSASSDVTPLYFQFYLKPYTYSEKASKATKKQTITSWVLPEEGMIDDYNAQAKTEVAPDPLQYFWFRVFHNNTYFDDAEILKIWCSLDGRMFEVRDLHTPASTPSTNESLPAKNLNGTGLIKLFDYIDSHLLHADHAYICDDAHLAYFDQEGFPDQIPLRLLSALIHDKSYYAKYSPGFAPMTAAFRQGATPNEFINSSPAAYTKSLATLASMSLIKLYESFGKNYEKILAACVDLGFLAKKEVTRLLALEKKKQAMLIELIDTYYAEEGQSASDETAINKKLDSITLRDLTLRVYTKSRASKMGQGEVFKDLQSLNLLFKFPWGSNNFMPCYHNLHMSNNMYDANTYYYVLHEFMENARYLERIKEIERVDDQPEKHVSPFSPDTLKNKDESEQIFNGQVLEVKGEPVAMDIDKVESSLGKINLALQSLHDTSTNAQLLLEKCKLTLAKSQDVETISASRLACASFWKTAGSPKMKLDSDTILSIGLLANRFL